MKKKILFYNLLVFFIFYSKILPKSILDGTSNIQYISDHLVFHDEGTDGYYMAQGFVRLNNGFTVISTCTAFLDTFITVSGDIDLRNTGKIELLSNLHLEKSVTFTGAGGMLNGRGNTIFLNSDLNLPDNYILNITGNTIIDGKGHDLILGKWANITVDDSITLTLRNLTLKNTYTNYTVPPIIPCSIKSMVTFDNIEISLFDDFNFNQGKLFIHNDVDITGTYKFSYKSTQPMLIESNSCLYFDKDTTFEFYPSCTNNSLFTMQDKSSILYLDGCTLQTTLTGMILTKGQLYLDNNVTFSSIDANDLYDVTYSGSINYGTTESDPNYSAINSAAWSPSGIYLAVGGANSTVITTDALHIYRFDGYNFKFITSYNYGTQINTINWHPSGKYLAVGGTPTTNTLRIFSFDGNNLNLLDSVDFGDTLNSVNWSPNGQYLAICGENTNDLKIYNFLNQKLNLLTSIASFASAYNIRWNPNGQYLSMGGGSPTAPITEELVLLSFDGNTLGVVDQVHYQGVDANDRVFTTDWSPDGNFLLIGGTYPPGSPGNILIYAFRYNTEKLSYITDIRSLTDEIHSAVWHPNGKYIIDGGITYQNFGIYTFTGSALNTIISKYFGKYIQSLSFSPNAKFLVVSGTPNSPSTQPELQLYTLNYKYDTTPQALSRAIKLGNTQLGSDYDIDVTLLGRNYNKLYGSLFYDNVN
ncbi:WD40 repeat domain-containing protein [Candidatus Babeliales bacterium]|nr:WD40 repeat domain-containing protein [Candidatus Babeliales bacterium]